MKFHNSSKRTNIHLGSPEYYDYVLVVLGPDSLLRITDDESEFIIYKISAKCVKCNYKKGEKSKTYYSCAKKDIKKLKVDQCYNI